MTAPERPEGLPEAMRWDGEDWYAPLGEDGVFVCEDGGRWLAWVMGVSFPGPQESGDTPVGALRALLARVGWRDPCRPALRALLGEEPEAEFAGHTPGPWGWLPIDLCGDPDRTQPHVTPDGWAKVALVDPSMRTVLGTGYDRCEDLPVVRVFTADARLIAAAPTLLRRAVDAEREWDEARAEVERLRGERDEAFSAWESERTRAEQAVAQRDDLRAEVVQLRAAVRDALAALASEAPDA